MTTTYRAAYWISDDRQGELVLTSRDESGLTDDELLAAARAEAKEHAPWALESGTIKIGPWTER